MLGLRVECAYAESSEIAIGGWDVKWDVCLECLRTGLGVGEGSWRTESDDSLSLNSDRECEGSGSMEILDMAGKRVGARENTKKVKLSKSTWSKHTWTHNDWDSMYRDCVGLHHIFCFSIMASSLVILHDSWMCKWEGLCLLLGYFPSLCLVCPILMC